MFSKIVIFISLLFTTSFSFGQSNLGHWSSDKVGLPTFNYTGEIPYKVTALGGEVLNYPKDPWFLLGNYGITAFVHTSGVFDLYTLRRAWGRLNVSTKNSPSTIAKINVDGNEHTITGLGSEIARKAEKVFGTGFANFKMQITKNVYCERTISTAPSQKINTGNGALLITVNLTNLGKETHQIEYSETVLANYQMIGELRISYSAVPTNKGEYLSAEYKPHTDTTIIWQDKEKASTYDFYPPKLFIKGNAETFYKFSNGKNEDVNLSANNKFTLKPGENKTITYVVGYKFDGENINEMANTLFEQGAEAPKFRNAWKEKLPDYSWQKDKVTKREQYWNTYVLEASAKYNTYFEETFIPQGMTYDYVWGLNAVARDHLHYSLPANYFNPELSKSIIRFVLKVMFPSGAFNYNVNGYGYNVPNLWSPSDLQLHLLQLIMKRPYGCFP